MLESWIHYYFAINIPLLGVGFGFTIIVFMEYFIQKGRTKNGKK